MPSFSQRIGLKPLQKPLQIDSMDVDLRNGLWSVLDQSVFSRWLVHKNLHVGFAPAWLQNFLQNVWILYLKHPSDKAGLDGGMKELREFFFTCPWNEVYDFIEFTIRNLEYFRDELNSECNAVLERENAGYRIVGQDITPITNSAEMDTVVAAAQSGWEGVDIHIKRSVELLSDRRSPDYRNAIKEAVSAVESACRVVSKDEKATLGQALKRISEKGQIHPALERALGALYGYTSDEGGIRHALLEESTITFTDAKFMVIACSAFVNYLVGKTSDLNSPI